jgi:small conductance mechanosensitive channel
MMKAMKSRFAWAVFTVVLWSVYGLSSSAHAQKTEQAEAPAGGTGGAWTDEEAGGDDGTAGTGGDDAEAPTEAASDAKRVVRIRKVIELDRKRIKWLKGELRERTRWFEELAARMEETGAQRNELRERLEVLEEAPERNTAQVEAVRERLTEVDENFEIIDTQTDLALKAEKIVRDQLEALEEKIEQEEVALGRLTGELKVELEPDEAPSAADVSAKTGGRGVELPPGVVPGAPASSADGTAALPTRPGSRSRTAAQLAAQRQLEEAEREVQLAKIDLEDFVERKRALQKQIEFEESLARGSSEERKNIGRALDMLNGRLEKYGEEGDRERVQRTEQSIRWLTRILEEGDRAAKARAEYIETLHTRLQHLEESELRITAEVDAAHEAEDKARRNVKWLESPIHPSNVAYWAQERGPRMLLVIVAALTLLLLVHVSARRIARTVIRRRRGERGEGTGRADTLAFSFRSLSRVLIVIFAALLVLQEAGVDVKTVLGGAAILGVAVAFGAQDLMKDYFSGFLILLEDQYQLGDLVTINGVTGTVESVNMRVTVLRDLEGRVHFMPNGGIDHVTNRTYAWGRPVFEIPVRFDEDVDNVISVLRDIAHELSGDDDWRGAIIGEPDMLGVDKVTESGVVVKFMVKTQPDKLFPVRREMLRRIVKRFAELGIQITVPQRILVRDGIDGDPL